MTKRTIRLFENTVKNVIVEFLDHVCLVLGVHFNKVDEHIHDGDGFTAVFYRVFLTCHLWVVQ